MKLRSLEVESGAQRSGATGVNDSPGDCQSRSETEPQRDLPIPPRENKKATGIPVADFGLRVQIRYIIRYSFEKVVLMNIEK